MNNYDVIIIGASCAGLTAGIYTGRRALKTLIISKDIGGQAATTFDIENYPGIDKTTGPDLMRAMQKQAEKFGAEIVIAEVTSIEKKENFIVRSTAGEYEATAVILSFGLTHRKLGVPGEKELTGHGVAYCTTCDAPFYKNKVVGVVGSGNAAFETAKYLATICKQVYLFARGAELRADDALSSEVKESGKVEIILNTTVKEIKGTKKVDSVIITTGGEDKELPLDGLFIDVGYALESGFVKDFVKTDERGFIIIDNENKTSVDGVFAAGDVTTVPWKQTVIAAGEGAKAALSVVRWVKSKK